MRLVPIILPAPNDATAVLTLPERVKRYRIISLMTEFTTLVTDTNVFAILQLIVSDQQLVMGQWVSNSTGANAAVNPSKVTFSSSDSAVQTSISGLAFEGTTLYLPGLISPDLWITAQMRAQLRLANATPGGGSGGGTTWGGTVRVLLLE